MSDGDQVCFTCATEITSIMAPYIHLPGSAASRARVGYQDQVPKCDSIEIIEKNTHLGSAIWCTLDMKQVWVRLDMLSWCSNALKSGFNLWKRRWVKLVKMSFLHYKHSVTIDDCAVLDVLCWLLSLSVYLSAQLTDSTSSLLRSRL